MGEVADEDSSMHVLDTGEITEALLTSMSGPVVTPIMVPLAMVAIIIVAVMMTMMILG